MASARRRLKERLLREAMERRRIEAETGAPPFCG
jgi:hypothetical protein